MNQTDIQTHIQSVSKKSDLSESKLFIISNKNHKYLKYTILSLIMPIYFVLNKNLLVFIILISQLF